ncbi:MAG: OmpH family outer membrane protein [Bacteroidales bacterium]|nr:OmpH family outer membrane protein [Bacteroidales bacterium]
MEENLEGKTEKEYEMNENTYEMNEIIEETVVNTTEVEQKQVSKPIVEEAPASCEKKRCGAAHWIVEGVLAAAVIALFILHFAGNGKKAPVVQKPVEKGNGETVFINIDSINAHYELVSILTDSIDAEKQRQAVVFQNRQKALEQKAANFEKNYNSGSLNPQQIQYAQQGLQEESTRLQNDYAQALESLEIRYQAALQQINDSLLAAANRVNATYNASYIFAYQGGGGSQLLYGDPAHDITVEVLNELNKSFKKKK